MVKAKENIEPAEMKNPIPTEPLLLKSVVSVKITVPLLQYGNIEMFASQEFYTPADAPQIAADAVRATLLESLRLQMAEQILPLAEAEVERAQLNSEFVKSNNKDGWMQRNNPTYRWLRVAAPDMAIDPMQEIINNQPAHIAHEK